MSFVTECKPRVRISPILHWGYNLLTLKKKPMLIVAMVMLDAPFLLLQIQGNSEFSFSILPDPYLCASIQGTPILGADVLEDSDLSAFVEQTVALRRQLRYILLPSTFAHAKRLIHWLGAHPGRGYSLYNI